MNILGLNAFHADASAAIFTNGRLIAATEEERFTRIKHFAGLPFKAINFCLESANINFRDLDYICISSSPNTKLVPKFLFASRHAFSIPQLLREKQQNRGKENFIDELIKLFATDEKTLQKKIYPVEHHLSHMSSAFFVSPFQESALLTLDGSGDFSTAMNGFGSKNKITVFDSVNYPHSIGFFYSAFTQLMGYANYGDEYKIMGLSSYGKPVFAEQLRKLIRLKANGKFSLDTTYFTDPSKGYIEYNGGNVPMPKFLCSSKMIHEFGHAGRTGNYIPEIKKDLAASVQLVTEEVIFHSLSHLYKKTRCKNLCLAGGVAQNSVANGKISLNTPFRNVFVPPAPHDAGLSIGSALYLQHQVLKMERKFSTSPYTGQAFSNNQIEKVLRQSGLKYDYLEDEELFKVVINKITNKGVIGWFSGKSEFGPRALGARSILADPRNPNAKDVINEKIKRRESFRPFAPSVLKEHANEFFEMQDDVPFMEKVYPVRKTKRSQIPAVTHIDGTGRLQTVDKDLSPRYYKLIETFYRYTGIPLLLNTSFNENEPIVNSPEEAISCFKRTSMDMLVLENLIVVR